MNWRGAAPEDESKQNYTNVKKKNDTQMWRKERNEIDGATWYNAVRRSADIGVLSSDDSSQKNGLAEREEDYDEETSNKSIRL